MSTSPATDRSVPDQWDEVWTVLQDEATKSVAAGQIRKLGLAGVAYSTDDLLNTVGMKLWRHLLRGNRIGDGRPDAIERYVYKALANAANDLFKPSKRSGQPVDAVGYGVGADIARHAVAPVVPDPNDVVPADWDATRAVAQAHVSPRTPWLTAAVLAHLAVDQDPDRTLPPRLHLPQDPVLGQNADWVALQYAGRDNCFDSSGEPRVRKRRSTALAQLQKAMEAILFDAWDLPRHYLSTRRWQTASTLSPSGSRTKAAK